MLVHAQGTVLSHRTSLLSRSFCLEQRESSLRKGREEKVLDNRDSGPASGLSASPIILYSICGCSSWLLNAVNECPLNLILDGVHALKHTHQGAT